MLYRKPRVLQPRQMLRPTPFKRQMMAVLAKVRVLLAAVAVACLLPSFFNPSDDVVNFSFTPTGGAAPLTVVFTNLTTTPEYDSYFWEFGDGSTSTSTNPTHVYQSGSTEAPYTCSLQTTNSVTGVPGSASYKYISASIPVVTAAFTFATTSNVAPFSVSFVNTSTNTSQTPTTTYKWSFTYTNAEGGASSSVSTLATPPSQRVDSGSFTASLQATGSYNVATLYTQSFAAAAPTLALSLSLATAGLIAPSAVTIHPTVTYNGIGTPYGYPYNNFNRWWYGEFTEAGDEYSGSYAGDTSRTYNTRSDAAGTTVGNFTASLCLTESIYGIAVRATQSFYVRQPSLSVVFTVASSSKTSPSLVTLTPTITYDGSGTTEGFWGFGEWSEGGTEYTLPTITTVTNRLYDTRSSATEQDGKFTASLHVTESRYGITASYTQSFALEFPTLGVTFVAVSSSNYSPSLATFTPTVTNNGAGTLTGQLSPGEFTEAGDEYYIPYSAGPLTYTYNTRSGVDSTGSFTASLQLTGSNYGVTASVTQSIPLLFPSFTTMEFTTHSFGFGGAENSYMEPVSMSYTASIVYNGTTGTLIYLWDFGSASFWNITEGEVVGTATTVGPHFRSDYEPQAGGFTASLQATGSYGVTASVGMYTQSFDVNT